MSKTSTQGGQELARTHGSGFTPGPWEVSGDMIINGMENIAEVCRLDKYTKGGSKKANARLIAAAPDLLDALQTLWAFIEDVGKSNPGWMGKLVIQDYAQMNEAYIKVPRAFARVMCKQIPTG